MKPSPIEDEIFQHLAARWALQILMSLSEGPMRFIDLRRATPKVGANTLTTCLGELEAAHLIERRFLPSPVAVQVYVLGELSRGLHPALKHLAHWKAGLSSNPLVSNR